MTKLFIRDAASDLAGAGQKSLTLAQGSAVVSKVTNTGASPPIQVTDGAAGQILEWISGSLAAVTISGTITINLWGLESAAQANTGFNVDIARLDNAGAFVSTILNSSKGVELGTAAAVQNWTGTPTSTTLVNGDRIRIRVFGVGAGGTMGTGRTFTTSYGAGTGVNGDAYINTTEALSAGTSFVSGQCTIAGTSTVTVLGTRTRILLGGASSGYNSGVSSISWSHSVAAGSTVMTVTVATRNGPVTGVTIDGITATKAIGLGSGGEESSIWYIVSPRTGVNLTCVVNCTSAVDAIMGYGLDLAGVDIFTPVRVTQTAAGSGITALQGTLTGAGEGDFVLMGTMGPDDGTGSTPTPDAGQTAGFALQLAVTRGLVSYEWANGVDNVVMGYTTLRSEVWRMTMAAFQRALVYGTITAAGTATVSATGTVLRTAQATIVGTSTVTPTGFLTLLAQETIAGAATVAPTGFLTLLGQETIAGAASLSLTAAQGSILAGQATIAGTGVVSAAGSTVWAAQATIAGSATLALTGSYLLAAQATINGTSALTLTGFLTLLAQETIAGTSAITAGGNYTQAAQATIAGAATLSLTGLASSSAQVTIAGAAVVSATGVAIYAAQATINGAATLSLTGRLNLFGQDTIAGSATVSANGVAIYSGQFVATGAATLSLTGQSGSTASIVIAGAATVSANAVEIITAQATINGAGTVSATGFLSLLAQVTIPGAATVSPTGFLTLLAQETINGAATVSATARLDLFGQVTISGTGLIAGTAMAVFAAQETIAGTSTVYGNGLSLRFGQATITGTSALNATAQNTLLAQALIAGTAVVVPTATLSLGAAALIAGAATLTGDARTILAAQALLQGQASLVLTGVVPKNGVVTIAGAAIVTPTATIMLPASVLIAGLAGGTQTASIRYGGAVVIAGTATLNLAGYSIQFDLLPVVGTLGRVQIEAYSPTGVKLNFGRMQKVLAFSYTLRMDALGDFKATIPADDERVAYLTRGTQLWFYREGEGLIFKGIVARKEFAIRDGDMTCEITGSDLGEELAKITTLGGRAYQGASLATFVADMVSGTGWASGSLDVPATSLLARFDYSTRVSALLAGAEQFKLHARMNPVEKTVDVGAFGDSSGYVFQNVDSVSPLIRQNPKFAVIADMSIQDEGEELWNKLIPIGGGEGVNQTTLRYSTRTTPYTIQSAVGPDGLNYYYIADATSVATYGTFERAILVKDAVPLANSIAGQQAVANALYDISVNYLTKHKDERTEYSVHVAGLKHYSGGVAQIKPGQKARVRYHGFANNSDGSQRVWRTVDSDLWILEFTRTLTDDGGDEWDIPVSTVDRKYEDFSDKMVDAFNSLHTLSVSLRNYTFQAPYILQRVSIDPAKTATLYAKLDANIALLHLAKLTVTVRAVRSNVSVASSGGGSTSSGGTSHSHSVSGSTSGGGSSHSHTVTGATTFESVTGTNSTRAVWDNVASSSSGTGTGGAGSSHNHASATTDSADGTVGFHAHSVSGGSGSEASHIHAGGSHTHFAGASYTVATALHAHNVNGSTSSAESSHSHSVTGSTSGAEATHTHTVSAHTHPLTYGIYVGTSPTNPGITITINGVDRTTILGGPFNSVNSEYTLDVTQYLQNGATEVPLQATNTITFDTGVLCDIEAVLRLDLTRSALIPV